VSAAAFVNAVQAKCYVAALATDAYRRSWSQGDLSYLLVRSTSSSDEHSRLVTPAAMAGVTRNGGQITHSPCKRAKGDFFGKAIVNRDIELNRRSASRSDIPFKPRTILIVSLHLKMMQLG
jgi:hypothetical protein